MPARLSGHVLHADLEIHHDVVPTFRFGSALPSAVIRGREEVTLHLQMRVTQVEDLTRLSELLSGNHRIELDIRAVEAPLDFRERQRLEAHAHWQLALQNRQGPPPIDGSAREAELAPAVREREAPAREVTRHGDRLTWHGFQRGEIAELASATEREAEEREDAEEAREAQREAAVTADLLAIRDRAARDLALNGNAFVSIPPRRLNLESSGRMQVELPSGALLFDGQPMNMRGSDPTATAARRETPPAVPRVETPPYHRRLRLPVEERDHDE